MTGGMLDGLGWLVGIILGAVVFAVIIGGIKSIAQGYRKSRPFYGSPLLLFFSYHDSAQRIGTARRHRQYLWECIHRRRCRRRRDRNDDYRLPTRGVLQ